MPEHLPDNFRNNDDVKYGALRVVDIPAESATHAPWFNQTLTTVNKAVVRLGIFQGNFSCHKHVDQDEFFLVRQHQGFTVPKGIMHRPRSPQRAVVLMVESLGITPTGDWKAVLP